MYYIIIFYIIFCSVIFYGECIIFSGSPNKNIYVPKNVCPFGRTFQHIQLYSQTTFTLFVNMRHHFPLWQTNEREE